MLSLEGNISYTARALVREAKAESDKARAASLVSVADPQPEPAAEPDPTRHESGRYIHPLHPDSDWSKHERAGRPARIKATPELLQKACDSIANGLGIESALILAGVTPNSLDRWRKENPLVEARLQVAERMWEEGIVAMLNGKAAAGDAKVGQWLLERRMSSRWLPALKTELTGANGGAIQHITIHKSLLGSVAGSPDAERAGKREPIKVQAA